MSDYEALMAERARLVGAGVPESELLMPVKPPVGVSPTLASPIRVSVGELRASNGVTYTVTLYGPGEDIGEGMCVLNTSKKADAEFEAQVWRDWLADALGVPERLPTADQQGNGGANGR